MKKPMIAALIFAIFAAGSVRAQEAIKDTKYVAVDKTKSGENVLTVNYPWGVHEKASIEVRLITDKKDFAARVRPLRFAMIRFDDVTKRHFLKTFDESIEQPSDWMAQGGGMRWQIIGENNHFDRKAMWFVNTPAKDSSIVGTTAAFSPLDPWAVSDRLLQLDLPRAQFEQPGKMYVWFLRGDRILWQEEVQWPGQK
jgi:hypothetical protein